MTIGLALKRGLVISSLIFFNISLFGLGDLPSEKEQELPQFSVKYQFKKYEPIKCNLFCLGKDPLLETVADTIKYDLEFSDQLLVSIKRCDKQLSTQAEEHIMNQDVSLCLYLSLENQQKKSKERRIKVVVKNLLENKTPFDKMFSVSVSPHLHQMHAIADELFFALTNSKGPMLCTIAYCKQSTSLKKEVCIADYACTKEKVLTPSKGNRAAVCWHTQDISSLFYSEYHRGNWRLVRHDLANGKIFTVCDYSGINMQPSFSSDGSKAVLCMSAKGNSELYLYDKKLCRRVGADEYKKLTDNNGNNASPCMIHDDSIAFCSDFESRYPQIYLLTMKTGKTRRLSSGVGYCADPTYCKKSNSLFYTRLVKGVFQLFCLNLNETNPREQQLTFCRGDKTSPTVSECGNHVAFTYIFPVAKTNRMSQQIAMLNINSGRIHVLTTSPEPKSYPTINNRPDVMKYVG